MHVKLFSLSLKGEASKWFSKLPHASITNFALLKTILCDHYQLHIAKKFTFSDLMKLKEREGHSIEKFIIFWTKKANHVHVDHDIKIMDFLEVLEPKYIEKYFDYLVLPLDAFL